ncbi:CWF19-like protein 2 [Nymphon striatum]|nr:CWF19-like protein 2 [Nymphon striatum]
MSGKNEDMSTMKGVGFVSKTKIDADRQSLKDERTNVLDEAEEKYRRKEKKAQERKERGEDKWMLPSVENRLSSKKSKKHKKEKKKKKKHKKKHEKSSSESGSDSDEVEWVEPLKQKDETKDQEQKKRDDWMTMPTSLFPCMSDKEIANRKTKDRDIKKERRSIDEFGQTDRELNPYWKNGGTGLPSEKPKKIERTVVGDGGLSWLRRAYKRVHEQAEEQGKSPEEIAAERWGSLEKLKRLINEAEGKLQGNHPRSYERHHKNSGSRNLFMKPELDSSSSNYHKSSRVSNRQEKVTKGWRKPKRADSPPAKKEESSKLPKEPVRTESENSSDSESEKEKKSETKAPQKVLTEKEMNVLGARILKFELMGNQEMADKFKKELDVARKLKAEAPTDIETNRNNDQEETIILTRTDKNGVVRPLVQTESHREPYGGRRKKQKVDTHDKGGERVRYFADDDNLSLKEMFESEKLGSAEDQNAMLARLAGRGMETNDDMDDVLVSRANKKISESRLQDQDRSKAISEHKKKSAALDNCKFCFEGQKILKHMIIAIGIRTYLCLPPRQSLTEGHCMIVPMQHSTCATQLDEDVWSEIQIFRKGLTKMLEDQDKVPVFFETNIFPKKFPHMVFECIPMPKEIGDLAPIYFKKAILESEKEWSHNKKLVDLSNKDVRKAIPAALPYFCVNFGLKNGFAHVIEEEKDFPTHFAKEIIGGMMDLEPHLWRKPSWENFDVQKKKVLEFSKWWKPYDWTHRLKEDA